MSTVLKKCYCGNEVDERKEEYYIGIHNYITCKKCYDMIINQKMDCETKFDPIYIGVSKVNKISNR